MRVTIFNTQPNSDGFTENKELITVDVFPVFKTKIVKLSSGVEANSDSSLIYKGAKAVIEPIKDKLLSNDLLVEFDDKTKRKVLKVFLSLSPYTDIGVVEFML